jgi:carboxyl-terminal processing protease
MVDSTLVQGLRQRSQRRVAQSEYFTKANRQIARYVDQKDRKTVTLNKEKFLKERAELDAEKKQEEMFDDMTNPSRPVYEMDGYGEEALDIVVDYVDLLGVNRIAIARPAAGEPQARVLSQ